MLELSQVTRTIDSTSYIATNTSEDVSIVVKYDGVVVVNIFNNERNIHTVFSDFDEAKRWVETQVCMAVSFS